MLNRRAKNFACLRVHRDFHESVRLALLDGTAYTRHRPLAHQHAATSLASFRFGQSHAAKRWVSIERVGRDAVADPARVVVEEVGGDDLRIVEGRVREGPSVAMGAPKRLELCAVISPVI